jgi:hypothetical protein
VYRFKKGKFGFLFVKAAVKCIKKEPFTAMAELGRDIGIKIKVVGEND